MNLVRLPFRGSWKVYGVCDARGKCPIEEFFQPSAGDAQGKDKIRVLGHLGRMADSAFPVRNNEITHIVDRKDRIWQTAQGDVRVLWFYDEGRVMILSHGFVKTTQETPRDELEIARRAARAYRMDKEREWIRFREEME